MNFCRLPPERPPACFCADGRLHVEALDDLLREAQGLLLKNEAVLHKIVTRKIGVGLKRNFGNGGMPETLFRHVAKTQPATIAGAETADGPSEKHDALIVDGASPAAAAIRRAWPLPEMPATPTISPLRTDTETFSMPHTRRVPGQLTPFISKTTSPGVPEASRIAGGSAPDHQARE